METTRNHISTHFKLLLVQILLIIAMNPLIGFAQIGNEWIVEGQKYVKIPVAKTGIYGVSGAQILTHFPTASSSFDNLQLFHRGKEQAIQLDGVFDGLLSGNDSLFFYGQINDGTLDSLWFIPGTLPHKYYNYYSDTSAYFLTMSASSQGKRMTVNSFSNFPTKATTHKKDSLMLFTSAYNAGLNYTYGDNINLSVGNIGEGWFGPEFTKRSTDIRLSSETFQIPIHHFSGTTLTIEGMAVGKFPSTHTLQIAIGLDRLKPDTIFTAPGFSDKETVKFSFTLPSKFIASGMLRVTGLSSSTADRMAFAYLKISYGQNAVLYEKPSKYFNIALPSSSASVFEMSSANAAAYSIFDVGDLSNVQLYNHQLAAGKLSISLTKRSASLYVLEKGKYFKVPNLIEVNLKNTRTVDSADFLVITHGKILSGALQYAEYRQTLAGGSHKVAVEDINNLYNRFTYGEKSPVAIKRYCMSLYKLGWDPKFLFIIGKGLDQHFGSPTYRKDPKNALQKGFEDLIPAVGYPPSDILHTVGLNGSSSLIPTIPTGRIPASNNAEVLNYLEKIKEHEALPVEAWRKNIIHISGGDTEAQGKLLKSRLANWEDIAEGIYFGGRVVSFARLTSSALKEYDDAFKQQIADEVNKGASYLTYFGHSSATGTEVDFGRPTVQSNGYSNRGKYPFMYMNGCHISNSFTDNSFSKDWLLAENTGAIAYLGHVHFGYTDEFNVYGRSFYRRNFQDEAFKNKSIGEIQIQVIKDYYAESGIFPVTEAHASQMMLQGDPSVKIFKPQLPDYKFESAFLKSFSEKPITATSDSFIVAINVSNLGISRNDSFYVSVVRTVREQNNVISQEPQKYPAVLFNDTLYFTVMATDKNTYGINSFDIKLDAYDSIAELSKSNNVGSIQFFMPASAVNPLFPKEFSIISSPQVELVAQSTDLMTESKAYIFEIDTSYLFNSPFKKSFERTAAALVKSGNIPLLPGAINDSVVYFWRVRYKDVTGEDLIWGESSFIMINGSKPGWSQSKFSQFLKDNVHDGYIDVNEEKLKFNSITNTIFVQVMGEKASSVAADNLKNFNFQYNNSGLVVNTSGRCGILGMIAVAFNNKTGDFFFPPGTKSYCTNGYLSFRPMAIFGFNGTDTSLSTQLITYLNAVPDDYYVLLFNDGNANFHKWSPALKATIKSAFKTTFSDSLTQGNGYILWAQKNTKTGPIAEKVASYLETISVNTSFKVAVPSAQITSTLIGPSSGWGTVYRKYKDVQPSDKISFELLGVNFSGVETVLRAVIKDTFSIADISTKDYPYLRLRATISDTANRTPLDLYEWQVIFNGIPEGTLNLGISGRENYKGISKNEGEFFDLAFSFENISQFSFADTLQARVRLVNDKIQSKDTLLLLKKLAPGEVLNFNYRGNTKGFDARNTLQLFVNPYLQAEEYYNNNILEIPISVNVDKTSPIVDVAIDGIHIINGDIVSPSPLINIRLNDENKYLTYEGSNDTTMVKVYLSGPCSFCSATVPLKLYSNPDVRYIGKGEGSGNNLVIDYNPQKLPDGKYTLTVSGKDIAGNNTQKPYQITFEVINKSSITYFYPYPNPFSTKTRFVFTLTGSEIPEDLKIQIMTVTGRVVREITKAELGPLRIGNNISQYAWDGFDEFGDKLANGVYLYRVIIKNPGENFKRRETSADKAFKKEFGKLYILR